MDSRLIFLHMYACDVVTDSDIGSPLLDWGPRSMAGALANPRVNVSSECERTVRLVAKSAMPGLEKSC